MSKKLIAVASAAALAVSLLVAAPASATAPTFTLGAGTGTGANAAGTAAAPRTILVPSANTIANGSNAITLDIASLAAGDVVTVATTGAVKVLRAAVTGTADINVSTLGVSALTLNRTDTAAVNLFVYTTSTTAGTVAVTVTRTGLTSSNTYHIQGIAGPAYNIAATGGVPATLARGATSVVTFTVSDVFGNFLEAAELATVSADAVRSSHMGLITWDAAAKVFRSTMTSADNGAFVASIDLASASRTIAGLPASNGRLAAAINVAGAGTQVANLTAQVAALTAQLANSRAKDASVTKKRFNTLARKWNAANPTDRVKLKR